MVGTPLLLSSPLNVVRYGLWTIGQPPQVVGMDLDMLFPDFYLRATSSNNGLSFDSSLSSTYGTIYILPQRVGFRSSISI